MKTAALILGMIAAFIALPAALCSGACAAALTSDGGQAASNDAGGAFLVMGLIAAVVAFASSILVMVRTRVGAFGLLGAFVLTVITCVSLNPLAFLVALFLFIAMLLAFFAARDEARAAMPQLANPYGAPQYGAQPYSAPQGFAPPQGGGYGPPQGGGYGGPPPQGGAPPGTPPQKPWQ